MVMDTKYINPCVHFLAGKGGVGKSVIAKALAQFFVEQGYKTLRVELSEEESPEGMCIRPLEESGPNLKQLRIFPDQSLYQYLSLKIPNKKLLKLLLSKNLFRALGSAMPGLSDLTRLGKIWFHADESYDFGGSGEIFQKIVVDLPSSGFVRRFLSVARIAAQAVKIGPLAKEALSMQHFFSDPNKAVLHVVTMPEELIVKETNELCQDMLNDKDCALGLLFINRVLPFSERAVAACIASEDGAIADIAKFFQARAREEEHQQNMLAKIAEAMPVIKIAQQWGDFMDTLVTQQLYEQIVSTR